MIIPALLRGSRWLCASDTVFYQPPNYLPEPFPSQLDHLVIAAVLLALAIGLAIVAVVQLRSAR